MLFVTCLCNYFRPYLRAIVLYTLRRLCFCGFLQQQARAETAVEGKLNCSQKRTGPIMFVAWKPLAYPQVPFVWVLWVVVFFCVCFFPLE